MEQFICIKMDLTLNNLQWVMRHEAKPNQIKLFNCVQKMSSGLFKNVIYIYLPTPPLGQDMTQGQFLMQNLTGLNSEFSFS